MNHMKENIFVKMVYIEHWGVNNKQSYNETKEYKLKIYKEKGITLISTTEKDMVDIDNCLFKKLKYVKKGQIND